MENDVQSDRVELTANQLKLLLASIFIIASCSLLYELLISSLSTYLLGSSVVHYSLTIGLFLFFMGVGSWLANYIERNLVAAFVLIEICIGIVGGVSALLLFAAYAWTQVYYPVMIFVIAIISILIGMEIPLLTRIFEFSVGIRKGISEILAFDYLGALIASIAFPFLLLPYFGHLLTAAATGLLNLLVASIVAWHFRQHLHAWRIPAIAGISIGLCLLLVGALKSNALASLFEQSLYQDTVVHSEQSRYQKLVVTQWGDDTRLFLDGSLQFSSIDEHRYHEVITHLPAGFTANRSEVLIIGGGDGLAAREILKYTDVDKLTIVDIDEAVSTLARTMPRLRELNQGSLEDERVTIVHTDAWSWLTESGSLFDLIIIDLPDPESEDTARLYTIAFYQRIARRLATGGVMMTQATSPWFAKRAFWSIGTTLEEVFNSVRPALVNIPSFGPWGFFMAAQHNLENEQNSVIEGRFLTEANRQSVLTLAADMKKINVDANRIGSLPLLEYYREGWSFINQGKATP